jgi:hypothetical protein
MDDFEKGLMASLGLEEAEQEDVNIEDQEDVDQEDIDQDDEDKDEDVDEEDKPEDKDVDEEDKQDLDDDKKEKKKVLLDSDDDDAPNDDFDELVSKKTGGKYKSYADIEAALETASENAFANEMVAKLNEYVKDGGNAEDFLKTQTTDFGKMSDIQVIMEREAMLDGTLTRDEIQLLIEDQFAVSEDATDREKTLARIKIKKAAKAAREELGEYQKKWAVPKTDRKTQEKLARQEAEKWKSELGEAVDKNAEVAFKVGKEEFKFSPSDDAKEAVKSAHDLSKFFQRYATKDGGYDVNKFVRDQYILNNIEDIISSAVVFAKGQGIEEFVDEMKNVDLDGKDKKKNSDGKKSILDQVGEHMF